MKHNTTLSVSLALLLSLFFSYACAQEVVPFPRVHIHMNAEFYVVTVTKDSFSCKLKRVIWGARDKSTFVQGFSMDSLTAFRIEGIKRDDFHTALAICEDNGDRYSLTFRQSRYGFSLSITNIDRKFPSYFISTTNVCLPPLAPVEALRDPPGN